MADEIMDAGKELRQFPRYNVASLDKLVGDTDLKKSLMQLVTFAAGGCGFVDVEGPPVHLTFPKRLVCHFSFEGVTTEKVSVQGNLLYVREVHTPKLLYFYGIEFIPGHRERLSSVLNELQKLHELGQVKTA